MRRRIVARHADRLRREGDDGQAVLGHTGGLGETRADASDRSDQLSHDFVVEGAEGEFELHLVRDDVAFQTAVDSADGDDGRGAGFEFAAHDGLEREDDLRGENDGILGGVRRGTVAADAAHQNIHRVHAREERTFAVTDDSGRQYRSVTCSAMA